ncbi:MAG: hypothetical protein SFV81_15940 [Pirellulaceae bacterium]|nr:hypothetical protein [Pirellulaceae bacterium]
MRQTAFLACVLVSICLVNAARAEEPVFTVQSSSTVRLLEVVQKLGLPDPIASAGLDGKATLDRMSDSISLNSPSGGFIFVTPERPQLVICLPLANINTFMNALDAFTSSAPVPAPNGVYAMRKDDKFYAKQAGAFLLLSDSPKFLGDAANALNASPWTNVKDDIRLKADFQRMFPTAKSLLLAELLSMTTTKPTAGLYLNEDSIQEHLKYGLQQFLAQSLFESRSFEFALNASANDEIRVQLTTQEDTTALRVPSMFKPSQAPNGSFMIDFASKISDANTQETLRWIANWETELLGAVDNDSIQNKSDVDSTKRIVKFFSGLAEQAVVNHKLDCFAAIGSNEQKGYLAGAVALTDSAKLAQQLADALEAAKQIGLNFTDLRAAGSSTDVLADYLIDLPKDMQVLGVSGGENGKLHVRVANQGLWVGIGNESEQLRQQVIATPDTGLSPVAIHCDLDAEGNQASENSTLLPFNFRKMKLNVQVTDAGRVYDIVLGNLSKTPLATPNVSAQAASN